jgi:hypothetical protein
MTRSRQAALLFNSSITKMRDQIAVELDRHQFLRDGNATVSLHADRLGRWRRRWFENSLG